MKILEILEKIKTTKSRKEKEKIIIENDSDLLRRVFYYAYEPTKLFYIQEIPYSKRETDSSNLLIEHVENKLFLLLDRLSNREVTGNRAKEFLTNFCNSLSYNTFRLVNKILKKDLDLGIAEKTLLKIYGQDFITDFQVQLANPYNIDKDYMVDRWFATPKLDGLRGVMSDGKLFSRKGKYLFGFEHIEEELRFLQDKYQISLFDGEMYSRNIPFQKIQSIVMTQKDFQFKDQIKYYIFAIDMEDRKFKNTEMMYKFMEDIQNKHIQFDHIVFIKPQVVKNDYNVIRDVTKRYIGFGYEGSMLRHPENYISVGRNDYLLKKKIFKEADLEIISINEGSGRNKGKMGSLGCKGVVEGKKIITEVGSGFSDKEREEIFNNKNKYIGKQITIDYQNITDGGKSLRIPIKSSIKLDR